MKKSFRNKILMIIILLLTGVIIGWLIKPSSNDLSMEALSTNSGREQIWTCSMHPQIRRNGPGQCPICGMDLVPLNSEIESGENPQAVTMSETAMQLANVQTMVVKNQKPVKEVRMPGKVQPDERLVFSQVSHYSGRIEQLKINFTGEEVKKGQTLAYIYSPELVTAEAELLEALKIKETQPALFEAAKEKLKNWKLTDAQINQVISTNEIQESFPVLADVSGIVLKKRVNTGDYIMKGMPLFDIADLSEVWILFDVYESDIPWIQKGSTVEFSIQSIPGEFFNGRVSFIDPVIDPQTRVARARIEFENTQNKLKPEMFASGVIKSELKGIKEGLVVPKSAVMWTGVRSVVYVKNTNDHGISFTMRNVVLGPSLGDSYVITSGLSPGTEIVVNGTFSVDAAAQLSGKPSMMNPLESTAPFENQSDDLNGEKNNSRQDKQSISEVEKDALAPLFTQYFNLKNALIQDDYQSGKKISETLLQKIKTTKMDIFKGKNHQLWMRFSSNVIKPLQSMKSAENIGAVRYHFRIVSGQFIELATAIGPIDKPMFVLYCPMANDKKGADWLSTSQEILNPYFGEEMINCGEVSRTIK